MSVHPVLIAVLALFAVFGVALVYAQWMTRGMVAPGSTTFED